MSLKVFFNREESAKLREKLAARGIFDVTAMAREIRNVTLSAFEVEVHEHHFFFDNKSKLYECACGRQRMEPETVK